MALFLLILALMRPVLVEQKQSQKLQSKELIIALDVSYSMRADDIAPTRLQAAKKAIKNLLQNNQKDSFSLFAFTTNPLILSPATTDHALLLAALSSLKVKNILTHGTNFQTLLEKIARLKMPHKELLLFSDGGDIADINPLLSIANKHHITIHAIATATPKGIFLTQQDGKKLKDEQGHLIISRLNPHLKTLALQSGGTFHTLQDLDASLDFVDSAYKAQKERLGYDELFWIPTLLALVLFLLSLIQIPKKILALVPFLALNAQGGILDWYYIQKAQNAYHDKAYQKAAKAFEKIEDKTLQSQLNLANSYYQAGQYSQAKSIYSSLHTQNPYFKKIILFKRANCAVQHKEYDKARHLYFAALRFGKDQDIIHNLHLIEAQKSRQRRDFAAVASSDKEKKDAPTGNNKKQKKKNETKSGGKKSMQQGAGSSAKGTSNQKNSSASTQKNSTLAHPLGYKAYELINKGYLDEKTPW